jgi:hypothetical protein
MPVLALVGLIGLVWLQLGKGLVVGLLGRPGAYLMPVLGVGLLMAVVWSAQWLLKHPEDRPGFWAVVPWLLGAAVLLKVLVAGWALVRGRRLGLWPGPALAGVLGTWLLTAGGLLILLSWLVPADRFPPHVLALGVLACVPLARILAAPLALEWGRHR